MDVCKEKYYGNTYRCPEHFGELPFVPRPFVVHVFYSVSEGQGGDAEIISAINDKSLLIFSSQFYILGFKRPHWLPREFISSKKNNDNNNINNLVQK